MKSMKKKQLPAPTQQELAEHIRTGTHAGHKMGNVVITVGHNAHGGD